MGKKGCFSFSISFILLAVPGVCRPMRTCAPSLLRFLDFLFYIARPMKVKWQKGTFDSAKQVASIHV
jgi:hypothetical protein